MRKIVVGITIKDGAGGFHTGVEGGAEGFENGLGRVMPRGAALEPSLRIASSALGPGTAGRVQPLSGRPTPAVCGAGLGDRSIHSGEGWMCLA